MTAPSRAPTSQAPSARLLRTGGKVSARRGQS